MGWEQKGKASSYSEMWNEELYLMEGLFPWQNVNIYASESQLLHWQMMSLEVTADVTHVYHHQQANTNAATATVLFLIYIWLLN